MSSYRIWIVYAGNEWEREEAPVYCTARSLTEARSDAKGAGYDCTITVGDVVNGVMSNEAFVEYVQP